MNNRNEYSRNIILENLEFLKSHRKEHVQHNSHVHGFGIMKGKYIIH